MELKFDIFVNLITGMTGKSEDTSSYLQQICIMWHNTTYVNQHNLILIQVII
jgi:hypothetical protein